MSFLAELKRRNVIRVAIAYVAVSWLVLQVCTLIVQVLELPGAVPKVVFVVLVIGFIPALVFSWLYELTPEGLKRESEVDRSGSITRLTGRKLDYLVIGVLGAIVALLLIDKFVLTNKPEKGPESTSAAEHAAPATSKGADGASGAASADSGRSIVVLPFADMSQAKDQEYFSDGLAEELLNLLAKVPQLRVISRSSAFSFKGKAVDIATIAKQLDVAHVLEGSVRKSGNQVRITVQLIDARNDAHLWSETYDRPLENIFAIQDEIAAAVVAQLKVTLLGAAPKAAATDPEAYALYLKGREVQRAGSAEGYTEAIGLFERALKASPDYAPLWRWLGVVYLNQAARGMRDVDEGIRLAREAENRALALQPDYAPAAADLAWIAIVQDRDLRAAVRHSERALALDPGDFDVLVAAAFTARTLGRFELNIALHRRQVELDPANPGPYAQLGKTYSFLGRDSEAIASYRKAIELGPGFVGVRHWLALVLLADKGDRAKAEEALALARDEPSEAYRLGAEAMAYYALGRKAESDAAMSECTRRFERSMSYNIAYAHAYRGETDQAFAALERALEYDDSGLSEAHGQPLFAPLHDDPRWIAFLRRIGGDPEQRAAIPFDVHLPGAPGTAAPAPGSGR